MTPSSPSFENQNATKKENYWPISSMNTYEKFINKIDNLEEMDNLLESYSLPKLNQEEIDQLDRPITRNENE